MFDYSLDYYQNPNDKFYFPAIDYSRVKYTEKGVRDAMLQIYSGGTPASIEYHKDDFESLYLAMCEDAGLNPDVLAKTVGAPVFHVISYCASFLGTIVENGGAYLDDDMLDIAKSIAFYNARDFFSKEDTI